MGILAEQKIGPSLARRTEFRLQSLGDAKRFLENSFTNAKGVIYHSHSMPGQRGNDKTQTSISLSTKELTEMRDEIQKRGLRGIGHLLEELWKEEKKRFPQKKNQKK